MGYDNLKKIYESKNSILYKGKYGSIENEVIVKILNTEFPSNEQIQQFNNEYDTVADLPINGIRKVLAKESIENNYRLILEYFDGITLKEYFNDQAVDIQSFLPIIVKICEILGEIHQAKIIHKDINSKNILIDKKGDVKIIDFGISTKYSLKIQNLFNPEHLEGTLAYISPEQTGRMNRTVDYRSDLYSLGVVLYEAFTGKLPFTETDSMQLIHAHIARTPTPLYEINPKIPKQLSEIVLKLLAKNAENRYQSAYGLKHDVQKFAQNIHQTGATFLLGEKDFSGQLSIPEILYGRENEVMQLIDIYENVSKGTSELLLISGFSGVGKSALVHEIHKPVTQKHGIYIEGKFDQFQKNIPYFAIIQSFTDAINLILKENDKQLNYWKIKIQNALGTSGKVITQLIPELELIIGKQAELDQLEGKEAQNRFNYVWSNLIKAISSPDHPLVMFIDDVQWADNASINLLKVLLTDPEIKHFLCITAYRDNEIDASHPFIQLTEELENEKIKIQSFKLDNLSNNDINNLLIGALNSQNFIFRNDEQTELENIDKIKKLSEIIYTKTQGNAFFTKQFITTLYEEKLLKFDFSNNLWQWDSVNIADINITDNVLELMANKVLKLQDETQDVLKIAACMGNRFDLNILSAIYCKSPKQTKTDLESAIYEGLILPRANESYKFIHDKIQQAVYLTIPEDKKNQFHYQTGTLLLKNTSEKELEKRIFDIVNQLNHGIHLINSQSAEKQTLSELNFKAGIKAKLSSAYETAYNYIRIAESLLTSESWTNHYQSTLNIYTELSDIAYLNGDYQKTSEYVDVIDKNATEILDTTKAYFSLLNSLRAQAKYKEAIKKGLEIVAKLGVKVSRASKLNLIKSLIKTSIATNKSYEQLSNMPFMSQKNIMAATKLLDAIGTSAYRADPQLLAIMVFKSLRLAMQYGYFESTSYGMVAYGMILGTLNKIEKSQFWGEVATFVQEKYNYSGIKCKTIYMKLLFVSPWKKRIHTLLPDIYTNYKTGLETGDLEFAGMSLALYFGLSTLSNSNLKELKNNVLKHSSQLSKLGKDKSTQSFMYNIQLIEDLTSESMDTQSITGIYFNEQTVVKHLEDNKAYSTIAHIYQAKLFIYYLFNEAYEIESLIDKLEEYRALGKGYYFHALLNFYKSLCLLNIYTKKDTEGKAKILKIVNKNQKQLGIWAKHCPENFEHKYFLVEAERMRILGKINEAKTLYDKAIVGANTHEFIQEEGIAFETAANFYLLQNQSIIARTYLQNAYRAYHTWGATAKLRQMEERYAQFISQKVHAQSSTDAITTTTIVTTTNIKSGNLELNSIIKASQSLSGEVNFERLMKNMVMIVMENAGAEYAVFIKNEDEKYLIQAKGRYDGTNIEVMQSEPIENSNSIPLNVVNYVIRTHKSIVLDNAISDETYSDWYITKNNVKSVFCHPISHKNKLVAVLYLENNLSTHVFTSQRIETINILSSQIAVSIENALLYDNLEKKVEQRTLQLQNAKNELEKSHKSITDSIMYAKRIQKAVLPNSEGMKKLFPEHLIFFKPRDIVSGDFFFIKQFGNKIFVAVADCTGHGVPGAFMSMLGIAILNELVRKAEIQNSAQLLDELRSQIKYSLQQTGQFLERQDGMDIAFATIDAETHMMSYAGAHNSLWIFRNSELIELKADKMPVGVFKRETPFTHHQFALQANDILYLFSDGYYSQFQHTTKETMKIKQFRNFVSEIHRLEFDVQKQKLETYLNEWKGSEPQVDDILIIGVKIGK